MKENRKVYGIILALSLLAGGYVITYYWLDHSVERLKVLSIDVVIALFAYIFMQIVKRQWFAARNWWDWLYYFGLLAAVMPTYFANESSASSYGMLAQFGTFFLLIPVFLDGKKWITDAK